VHVCKRTAKTKGIIVMKSRLHFLRCVSRGNFQTVPFENTLQKHCFDSC